MEGQLIHGGSSKLEKTVSFHRQENANEQKFESLDDFHGISGISDSIKNGMLKLPIVFLSKELLLEIVKDLLKFCSSVNDSSASSVKIETLGFKAARCKEARSDKEGHQIDAENLSSRKSSRRGKDDACSIRNNDLDFQKGFKVGHRLKKCSFCNKRHFWRKELCSSFGKRCSHCNILNHCEEACYWKHPELLENNKRHFVERNLKASVGEQLKVVKTDEASASSTHRNSETSMLGIIKDLLLEVSPPNIKKHRGSPKETTKPSDEVAEKAKFSEERKAVTETTDEKEGKAVKHKSSRKGKDGKKRQKAKKKASKRSNEGINSVLKDKQVEPLEKECIELNDKAKVLQPEKADEEKILKEELDVKADAVHDNLVREQKNLEATDVDEWKELYAWSEREAIKDEASRQVKNRKIILIFVRKEEDQ